MRQLKDSGKTPESPPTRNVLEPENSTATGRQRHESVSLRNAAASSPAQGTAEASSKITDLPSPQESTTSPHKTNSTIQPDLPIFIPNKVSYKVEVIQDLSKLPTKPRQQTVTQWNLESTPHPTTFDEMVAEVSFEDEDDQGDVFVDNIVVEDVVVDEEAATNIKAILVPGVHECAHLLGLPPSIRSHVVEPTAHPPISHPPIYQAAPVGGLPRTPAATAPQAQGGGASSTRGSRSMDRARRDGVQPSGDATPLQRPLDSTQPPPQRLAEAQVPRRLLIKVDPSLYGVSNPSDQTHDNCYQESINFIAQLWKQVSIDGHIDWFDHEPACHLLGFLVARHAKRGVIAGVEDDALDCLLRFNSTSEMVEAGLTISPESMACGVNYDNPALFFSPFDHLQKVQQPPEALLQSSLVTAVHLIQSLQDQQIEVTVEYRASLIEGSEDEQKLEVYNDVFLKGTFKEALQSVASQLQAVYTLQVFANDVSEHLNSLAEDELMQLDEEICTYLMCPEMIDEQSLKTTAQSMLKASNKLSRAFNMYERHALKTIRASVFYQEEVQDLFSNHDILASFMANDSSPSLPYIQYPEKYTSLGQVKATGEGGICSLAAPSRLHVPLHTTPIPAIIERVRSMVERTIQATQSRATTAAPPPPAASPAQSSGPSIALYPHSLIEDAEMIVHKYCETQSIKETSIHELNIATQKCEKVSHQLQQLLWSGLILRPSHRHVMDELSTTQAHISEALHIKKEAAKAKDIETRELSKAISSAKPVILAKDSSNILQFLQYHSTFSSANPLQRCLRLREALPEELRQRVLFEDDPDKILKFLKDMFLSEDFMLPLARAELTSLPLHPPVNSQQEKNAFTTILSFVLKLEKQDIIDRFDFSTIQQAVSRLSLIRQDDFERKWAEESLALEGKSHHNKESKKRDVFIKFIKLNEGLLCRRLMQKAIDEKEKVDKPKPKDKTAEHKKERAFNTDAVRVTRYDKRNSKYKSSSNKPDGKSDNKADECKLCHLSGGHPSTKQPSKAVSSLARCPQFRQTAQKDKLALLDQLKACQLCLSWTHQAPACRAATASWLYHECAKGQPNRTHNPWACPHRRVVSDQGRQTCNRVQTFSPSPTPPTAQQALHLMESIQVKPSSDASHTIDTIVSFDGASDSNWVSKEFAARLPKRARRRVTLTVDSIPAEVTVHTYEHSFFIVKGEETVNITAYETSKHIGFSNVNETITAAMSQHFNVKVEVPNGAVDLLIGLANIDLHPQEVPAPAATSIHKNLKLFTSSLIPPPAYRVSGIVPKAFTLGANVVSSYFTVSELQQHLLKENPIDRPQLLCSACSLRSKRCAKCLMKKRPISKKEQNEIDIIHNSMTFDTENKAVHIKYVPLGSETFQEMFPPQLSNKNECKAISKSLLKQLKKENMVDQFQEALHKSIKNGVFVEMSKGELDHWEDQKLPVNYLSINYVNKLQSSSAKTKLRIVTNTSLRRRALIKGKIERVSLNNVLPAAKPQTNLLADIILRWMEKEVSISMDQQRAYHSIQPEPGLQGEIMQNLRRFIWWDKPEEEESKLQEVTFKVRPLNFGDAPAAAALDMLRSRVAEELIEDGKERSARLLQVSSYVDDNLASEDDLESAFTFFNDVEKAFLNYGATMHVPIFSTASGRYMEPKGSPIKVPPEGEEVEQRILGFMYDPYKDQIRLPVQRIYTSKKKKGLRTGSPTSIKDVDSIRPTLRNLSSFQLSTLDIMGYLSPLFVQGKLLLTLIQEIHPPNLAESWDKELTGELADQVKKYIKDVLRIEDPIFPRSPPSGQLTNLHVFVDGGKSCYGCVIYGLWTAETGQKNSKLLLAKTKIGKRSIPDMELSSMDLGVRLATHLTELFERVTQVDVYGDSTTCHFQIRSSYSPKDTFTNNRYQSVHSYLEQMKDRGIIVKIHLVRSAENRADPCSKFRFDALEIIKSSDWWIGPHWLGLPESQRPIEEPLSVTDKGVKDGYNDKHEAEAVENANIETVNLTLSARAQRAERREQRKLQAEAAAEEVLEKENNENSFKPEDQDDKGLSNGVNVKDDAVTDEHVVEAKPGEQVIEAVAATQSNDTTGPFTLPCPSPSGEQPDLSPSALPGGGEVEPGGQRRHRHRPQAVQGQHGGHAFSGLLERSSRIGVACGAVARVMAALKQKSFKAAGKTPTKNDIETAFKKVVFLEQNKTSKKVPLALRTQSVEGLLVTTQRWTEKGHLDLFRVPYLPVVNSTSPLAHLVIRRAHLPPQGACASSDAQTWSRVRTGEFACYIYNKPNKILKKIRETCVSCLRQKCKPFTAAMSNDEYKQTGKFEVWNSCSLDMLGPCLVAVNMNAKDTRSSKKWHKSYILVIVDNSGVGSTNLIPLYDASAGSFCLAFNTHCAMTGKVPSIVYSDQGKNFVAVKNKEENDNAKFDDVEEPPVNFDDALLTKQFPKVEWRLCQANAQWKNSKCELVVKAVKTFVKSVFSLKRNAPLPRFSPQGLLHLCMEASHQLNERPISWLTPKQAGIAGEVLSPNHFLKVHHQPGAMWTPPASLDTQYEALQGYRERMAQGFKELMRASSFLPGKWYKNISPPPKVGQVVLNSTARTKVQKYGHLEYALVCEVSEDNRNLKLQVNRGGKIKMIESSARNAILLFDPSESEK